jgi:hypothetical protein
MTKQPEPSKSRHGKLSIPLPFDDAIRAALNVKPPEKPPRKRRRKRNPEKPRPDS